MWTRNRGETMKEIIGWLIGIERMAGHLYRNAALSFKEDKKLADFLEALGEDEAWHFHIMGSAAEYLRTHQETPPSQIILDEQTKKRIEAPFRENLQRLTAGQLTKESLLSCIAATEFSEWNDFFLYVVNSFKEESREFQYVAARMQGHLKHIMDFLGTMPEGIASLEKISNLPSVWREKVLVVEDDPLLLQMMKMILRRDYSTATAENGLEALEQIKENYFDAIISDIEMPMMNGIELLQEAIRHDQDIGRRFLFYSGLLLEERKAVLDEHHIPHLSKPAGVTEIKQKVAAVVEKNRRNSLADTG